MASLTDLIGNHEVRGENRSEVLSEKEAVVQELDSILNSAFFRTTRRAKQFLAYVVRYKLEEHHESLKERIIGADLFQRPVGYSTGDDAVVRVQAGDVRRRLEQYYHVAPNHKVVRIELPVGSYTPEFIWSHAAPPLENSSETKSPPPGPTLVAQTIRGGIHRKAVAASLFVVLLLLSAASYWAIARHREGAPKSALEQFWSPAFSNSEPILICLAKPAVYRPKAELYRMHTRPGQFDTEFERLEQAPALKPNDKLEWRDMAEYPEFGVASGDAYAAVQLSKMLVRIGKATQLRIGDNYSFEDLRNFPAIVVGGFNNRWAMDITSSLHFTFVEENGAQMIREQGPTGRRWSVNWMSKGNAAFAAEDYGLVSRLIDSRTGQFVVSVAGITADGTQAVSEFVSNPEYLEKALQNAPLNWAQKNMQIVIRTTVTDSVAGPPRVVAVYSW
jgi:hypothetical protein